MTDYINRVFFDDSRNMKHIPNNSVDLIVTSPPYFNIKDYSMNGYQSEKGQIGDIGNDDTYIKKMLAVWKECHRVLAPNGYEHALNADVKEKIKYTL